MREVTISISAIVGSGICVAAADGHAVHDVVVKHLEAGTRVTLSFSGVTRMTTAFLNAAVGQLYGEFTEVRLKQLLGPPRDAEPWHLTRLKLVVDRAKQFFANPERSQAIFRGVTGEDDE